MFVSVLHMFVIATTTVTLRAKPFVHLLSQLASKLDKLRRLHDMRHKWMQENTMQARANLSTAHHCLLGRRSFSPCLPGRLQRPSERAPFSNGMTGFLQEGLVWDKVVRFALFLINSSVSCHEKIDLEGIDHICATARFFMGAVDDSGPCRFGGDGDSILFCYRSWPSDWNRSLKGRCLDLQHAFKQLVRHPDDNWVSIIAGVLLWGYCIGGYKFLRWFLSDWNWTACCILSANGWTGIGLAGLGDFERRR